ncbi:xylulokinase [Clostridium sediminicola]|uniref:FGGY-family carbohydrate kinase n=1 Tax=Clostridium sediminicola TaxID=3114879 RepID=UPI0031F22139
MAILLGIDIGTTNWKAVAFDENGEILALKKTPTKTKYDDQKRGYYDPIELWNETATLIREVVKELDGAKIDALSVTSMTEAIVPIDENGEPCFNIMAWFDTRAREQAEKAVEIIGKEKLFSITGLEPNPIFPIFKIMWIKDHYPEVYDKSVKFLQMADYIYWCLCRKFATDFTIASRTLAMDLNKNAWSEGIFDKLDLRNDLFPEIFKSGTVLGNVTEEACEKTGLSSDTPIVVGGHDHPCATLASGIKPGMKVMDSSGTAESFLFVSKVDSKVPDKFDGLRIARHLDPRYYVSWGGIISSGVSVLWAMDNILSAKKIAEEKGVSYNDVVSELVKEVENVPVGANGVMYIPHLRGSGAPTWNPADKGTFLGLNATTTSNEMIRAVFEGLSFQARMILELQEKTAGVIAESICTVGGGTNFTLWQQIKSDITGKVIEIPAVEEGTAHGAALLAGVGIGVYKDMHEASMKVAKIKKRYYPNPEIKEKYDELYEIFKDACVAVSGINNRLDNIS